MAVRPPIAQLNAEKLRRMYNVAPGGVVPAGPVHYNYPPTPTDLYNNTQQPNTQQPNTQQPAPAPGGLSSTANFYQNIGVAEPTVPAATQKSLPGNGGAFYEGLGSPPTPVRNDKVTNPVVQTLSQADPEVGPFLSNRPRLAEFVASSPRLAQFAEDVRKRRGRGEGIGQGGILRNIMAFARENPMATMGFGAGLADGGPNAFNNAFANMQTGYQNDLSSRAPSEEFGPIFSGQDALDLNLNPEEVYQRGPDGRYHAISSGGVNIDLRDENALIAGRTADGRVLSALPAGDYTQYRQARDADGNTMFHEDDNTPVIAIDPETDQPIIDYRQGSAPWIEQMEKYGQSRDSLYDFHAEQAVLNVQLDRAIGMLDGTFFEELERDPNSRESQELTDHIMNFFASSDTAEEFAQSIAGFSGFAGQYLPGTHAYDLAKTLDTIRAITGFRALQNMRKNNPSGGALGQISNMENRLLQAVQGSTAQGQSSEQLLANLRHVQTASRDLIVYTNWAYREDFTALQAGGSTWGTTFVSPFPGAGTPEVFGLPHEDQYGENDYGAVVYRDDGSRFVLVKVGVPGRAGQEQDQWMSTPWQDEFEPEYAQYLERLQAR